VPVASLYVFFYAGLGLLLPLLPLYLTEHGLPAHVATSVVALGPLAAIVVPPAVGFVADAFGARAAILRGATLLCVVALLAYMRVPSTVTALVSVSVAYSILRAPIPTLVDAAAYAAAERTGTSYGRLRLFGSLGFLAAVLVGGELAHAYGWDVLLWATTIAFAFAFLATLLLPAELGQTAKRTRVPWLALLQRRELWLFLAVVAVSQMANGAYDACYALHLDRLGFSERFIGFAWGVGVLAEVIVLLASAHLVRMWGAERLLAFAFATGAVRWLLVASATSAAPILALQLLHGITFPLYWVPAVILVHKLMPRELVTAAQGLLTSAAGIGSVIGMMLAGPLLENGGGERVYTYASATALVAAVGAVLLARTMTARGDVRAEVVPELR
jgi:MFS transporter, PPP family, 3-phenylpropionic acid transporter